MESFSAASVVESGFSSRFSPFQILHIFPCIENIKNFSLQQNLHLFQKKYGKNCEYLESWAISSFILTLQAEYFVL